MATLLHTSACGGPQGELSACGGPQGELSACIRRTVIKSNALVTAATV